MLLFFADAEAPKFYDPLISHNGKAKPHHRKFGPDLYWEYTIDLMRRNRELPFVAFYAMTLAQEISNALNLPAHPGSSGKLESYNDLVEPMDENVEHGKTARDDLGQRENRVVMFLGENGTPSRFITDVKIRPNERPRIKYLSQAPSSFRHCKRGISSKTKLAAVFDRLFPNEVKP